VRTIAVTNQKGGVGKTTTVANLGAALAGAGHSVCLVDLDPQANLTTHFGINARSLKRSMYDVLLEPAPLTSAAVMVEPNLTVVPATIDLAAAEAELAGAVGREQILRDRLAELAGPYEIAMIDCPPSLGLLTLNALAAADEVLIPLQPHFLALQGLGKLLETVSLVQKRINPRLRVTGVILCMYESGTKLAGEVVADLRNFFESGRNSNAPWSGARIFGTVIRRNVKLAESPSYGKTIFDYEPKSHGATDYKALADEFLAPYVPPMAQGKPAVEEGKTGGREDGSTEPARAGEPSSPPPVIPSSSPPVVASPNPSSPPPSAPGDQPALAAPGPAPQGA
jgi:chromosome partitioning protein